MEYGKLDLVDLSICFLCTLPTHLPVSEPPMLVEVTGLGMLRAVTGVGICKQQRDHTNDQGIK